MLMVYKISMKLSVKNTKVSLSYMRRLQGEISKWSMMALHYYRK